MTTLLIDGDIVIYKAACVAETPINWGDGIWTLHTNEEEAQAISRSYVENITKKLKADKVVVCFSDKENFRKDILPEYKANRDGTRKPMLLQELREFMGTLYPVKVIPKLEADDVMGVISTRSKDKTIIVSEDKDMEQIPGWIFNPNKDEEPRKIGEEQADLKFYIQAASGDPTDNYAGCPGVGEKTALKAFEKSEGTHWEAVLSLYEKKGLTEDDALLQARMARILRAEDYDFKKKQPKLWEPSL